MTNCRKHIYNYYKAVYIFMFKVKWTNCSHNDYKLYAETKRYYKLMLAVLNINNIIL